VIIVIFIISLAFPGGWEVGTWSFRYPDYRTWFKSDTAKYKDIQIIIASIDTADYQFDPGNDSISKVDSLSLPPDSLQQTSIEGYNGTHPFEFPQGQDTLLFPLFRAIDKIRQRNKLIRILHYGDSQIEGDRITATIRNYMQKNYGGQGIGFLPVVPANDVSITFQQDISPNWQRVSVLNKENTAFNLYGIAGNLARYTPSDKADSIAHVGLKPFYVGYRNVRTFTHARLFYGPATTPFTIVVNRVNAQRMMARNTVSSAWWRFEAPQNSLDLSLVSSSLPDLYGIALDGACGVAVDNLPLRGSSGLDFTRMDTAQMGQMFRMMDVEMLILQFGANIVPNVVENYDYYARKFVRELRLLKALKPSLVIVVVGVSDMSQKSPDGYKSYPNIGKIRDAQKKAAFETGCVFWDLYEAMGGENSMPGWAFAQPPLAQKDFVHFTIGGARIVAELFCRAWAKEYQKYSKP
jgi:hypothetical protein